MKRNTITVACIICLIVAPIAFASLIDDHSTNQGQQQGIDSDISNKNTNTNLLGNDQDQQQGQGQKQTGINTQGQMQGNLGIQKGNDVNTDVKVEGDDVKTYANAWPSLSGGEGVSQVNAYSIMGGMGLSNTERYKALIIQIQAVEAIQSISTELKAEIVGKLVQDMVDTNKTQRVLGILWETSGRNITNLFGVLSADSFWKDGQHPFVIQEPSAKTVDTLETYRGNEGTYR